MKKWLKRVRGAVGMGLTWAAAWSVAGPVIMIVGAVVTGDRLVSSLVDLFFTFGMMGLVGGAAFSLVLGITEGRRRFDQMSLPRFAALGAVGGLLLSMLVFAGSGQVELDDLMIIGVILPLMGAGSAAGSLALARCADDRELLEAGEEAADVGLSEQQTRELLGRTG